MEVLRLLCLGTRYFQGSKKHTAYIEIDENQNIVSDEVVHYSHNSKVNVNVIYTVQSPEKGSILGNSFEVVERLKDEDQSATQLLEHEAHELAFLTYKKSKKAQSDKTGILNLLWPLRQLYKNTNALGKMALEVRILNYLRNGKDLK